MSLLSWLSWSAFALTLCTPALAAPATVIGPNLVRDLALANLLKSRITVDPERITRNWTGNNVCDWDGFACVRNPNANNRLSLESIDFTGWNFGGDKLFLNGILDKMVDLGLIHLNNNRFIGQFPDLSALPYLFELDASANEFTGTFPLSVVSTRLTWLDLRFNHFSGPIPDQVFTVPHEIVSLFLNDNKFSGPIPNSVGQTKAKYLSLANLNLSGSLPNTIAQGPNIQEIIILNNGLTGKIPAEIGAAQKLVLFDVSNNKLTGGVPEAACASTKIEILNFANNYLTEPLGPKCLALQRKKILNVTGNCMPGESLHKQRPASECVGR